MNVSGTFANVGRNVINELRPALSKILGLPSGFACSNQGQNPSVKIRLENKID